MFFYSFKCLAIEKRKEQNSLEKDKIDIAIKMTTVIVKSILINFIKLIILNFYLQ